jgi:hypothetical protein
MTLQEAEKIVLLKFMAYYGVGYNFKDAVCDYLTAHSRGKGIRFPEERRLYTACRIYWAYITAPNSETYPRNKQWRQENYSTYSYPENY